LSGRRDIARAERAPSGSQLRELAPRPLPSPTPFISPRAMATTMTNGDASHAPIEVSFPLPKAPHTNIHVQLTDNGPNLLLFLTTSSAESASSSTLGSFVYAMPNVSAQPSMRYAASHFALTIKLIRVIRELHQPRLSAHHSSPTVAHSTSPHDLPRSLRARQESQYTSATRQAWRKRWRGSGESSKSSQAC
jgi:hypothetical protein